MVTIGAPFDPAHVTGLLGGQVAGQRHGRTRSRSRSPAGRSASAALCSTISPQQNLAARIARLAQSAAGLSFADRRHGRHRQCQPHFPRGETSQELHLARRRRSSRQPARATPTYIAHVIAAWAERYLGHGGRTRSRCADTPMEPSSCAKRGAAHSSRKSVAGRHRLLADEPVKAGGMDSGPGPTICCSRRSAPAPR